MTTSNPTALAERPTVRRSGGLPPIVIAVAGHVASGKSTVARELARRIGAVRIEGDRVHDELLEDPGTAPHEIHWWRGFAPGFEKQLYGRLLELADETLASEGLVILDACFPRNDQRLAARLLAWRHGAAFLFAECVAGEATVRARLAEREAQGDGSGGWQAIHDELARHWEPVSALAPDERVVIPTDGFLDDAVSALLTTPMLRNALEPRPAVEVPRPQAVTFDCWNTLLTEEDWPAAHALRVEELRDAARTAGRDVSREEASRAFDEAWGRHMHGWTEGIVSGAREVALWGLAELGLTAPHPALEQLIETFEEASHSSRVLALDGARHTLEVLGRAGIPCALVCDTGLTPGRVVRRHLDRLGLLEGLSVQVFSDEVGVPKPDPRAFRAALQALGVAPEHALHVGDLRRTDIAGGRNLGLTTVRIRARFDDETPLPDADHVVASHAELSRLLGLDG